MPKKIVQEDSWPHGATSKVVEAADDPRVQQFLQAVALAARTSGVLDDGVDAVVKLLKHEVTHPAMLHRELKRMSVSAGRAAQTARQVRKGL